VTEDPLPLITNVAFEAKLINPEKEIGALNDTVTLATFKLCIVRGEAKLTDEDDSTTSTGGSQLDTNWPPAPMTVCVHEQLEDETATLKVAELGVQFKPVTKNLKSELEVMELIVVFAAEAFTNDPVPLNLDHTPVPSEGGIAPANNADAQPMFTFGLTI
jgi:hypothetical protein